MGACPARCRAGPPTAEDRLARLREDRRTAGIPLPRERGGRPRRQPRRADRAVRRGGLRGRIADRPTTGHSGRGPSGLVGGHRARGLVQRPPRLPAPRVRSLPRARGRHRERQCRARRRADARAHERGARAYRHDGRCHRGDRLVGDPRDRRTRASRAGSGIVDVDRSSASLASSPERTSSSTRTSSCSTRPARRSSKGGSNIVQRNVEILRDFATREPAGKPRSVRLRFRVSPVAIHGEERVEAVEIARNRLEADERRTRSRGRDRGARGHSVRNRLSQRRLPRRRHPGCAVRRPRRNGAERERPRPRRGRVARSRVSTAPAGSSVARQA